MTDRVRLGVNIDHVATLRNARGGDHPDPVRAAQIAREAGADQITAHLREDRRHVRDDDMWRLKEEIALPLNFEMAATEEMIAIARRLAPHSACLVPERREERTTEGGLDVIANRALLAEAVAALTEAGIRVALFVEPDPAQLDAARAVGAPVVELHTGRYCELTGRAREEELARLAAAARHAAAIGLCVHAGHGLGFDTVGPVVALPEVEEVSIGHFMIGEAIFLGLGTVIREMRRRIDDARAGL